MTTRCIEPANGPVDADFLAAPSKSATHRALVAAALADGSSEILGVLDSGDTRRTLDGLRELGIQVDERGGTWVVHGKAGAIPGGGTIDVGASGTSARFLLALAALGTRPSWLDGTPRLRERPIEELIRTLSTLGASVEPAGGLRFPLRAGGSRVVGGSAIVSGARSSQFASALLLAAPAFMNGLQLEIAPPRVSRPYVRMTLETLEAFGVPVATEGEARYLVPPSQYAGTTLEIEGDYSSASYMFAATAILGGRVRVRGLRASSTQPDARFLGDLMTLGCRIEHDGDGVVVVAPGRIPPFSWNLGDAPDLAPTAAVLALFAEGACELSGLTHLTLKESDRLALLGDNLAKLGAVVGVDGGVLSINPPPREALRGATIMVAQDHRIAMAFAIAGLALPGLAIDDPDTVAKSYPGFWGDFAALVRTGS